MSSAIAKLVVLALSGSLLLAPPIVAGEYVDPFKTKDPDVYFNLSIPTVSPFFKYNGQWSDGGKPGPTTLYPNANFSFYAAGTGAFVYAHTNNTSPASQQQQQPLSMLANAKRNGTSLGDGKWVYGYSEPDMLYVFALVDGVQPNQEVNLDSVTIQSGMYTEATSFDEVYCKTEQFKENSTLPLRFQGSWTFDVGSPQAWGGSVVATLPQNTSYVWINASTVTTEAPQNTLNIFMTRGTTPLNYIQISLNSLRSFVQNDMIVYQAPLDPKDQYELTLSAPANNLIKLDSITYCSYYKDGNIPASAGRSNKTAALIGGLVGGIVGGLLILGLLAFCLFRRRKHRLQKSAPAPDSFFVDESATAEPIPIPDKRILGSVSGVPRSSSPQPMRTDSFDPTLDTRHEEETKNPHFTVSHDNSLLSVSGGRTMSGDRTLSGDRTFSGDSHMSSMTGTTERQNSKDTESGRPRRPRRPRRTRHVVEHAEDGGEVRVENGEQVVVEVLPPQYQPEWEERRNRTT